ncbi:MAG: LysR family transcriptional regulator [Gammaproteobacteria bacterium]|jgi:LysR family glycine cleavage system transcriptional activator|nr:LysR family transcriptional regulator [Gammaproteobacteria bacterium]MCP4881509.1 LysR family transcriptional regulator [Gammaproteobacteria bacterium]MDP6165599.1 LysR family transcriptional regulator [Gammaproteobacteria bacterium]
MEKIPSTQALRCFASSAHWMSFVKAAKELCLTPAAVSVQIRKLEDSLGIQLFQRYNRRIELTEAGEKYLQRIRHILNDLEAATRDIKQKGDLVPISVAAPPTFLKYLIIPALASLYQLHDHNLRFIDTLRNIDFDAEDIDIWIRYGLPFKDQQPETLLLEENLCPVCSPKLIQQTGTLEAPDDLHKVRLLYTERRLVQWDNYFIGSDFDHQHAKGNLWFLNSVHTLDAALAGHGVALMNREFATKYIASGELVIPFEVQNINMTKPGYYLRVNPNQLPSLIDPIANWLLKQVRF